MDSYGCITNDQIEEWSMNDRRSPELVGRTNAQKYLSARNIDICLNSTTYLPHFWSFYDRTYKSLSRRVCEFYVVGRSKLIANVIYVKTIVWDLYSPKPLHCAILNLCSMNHCEYHTKDWESDSLDQVHQGAPILVQNTTNILWSKYVNYATTAVQISVTSQKKYLICLHCKRTGLIQICSLLPKAKIATSSINTSINTNVSVTNSNK